MQETIYQSDRNNPSLQHVAMDNLDSYEDASDAFIERYPLWVKKGQTFSSLNEMSINILRGRHMVKVWCFPRLDGVPPSPRCHCPCESRGDVVRASGLFPFHFVLPECMRVTWRYYEEKTDSIVTHKGKTYLLKGKKLCFEERRNGVRCFIKTR